MVIIGQLVITQAGVLTVTSLLPQCALLRLHGQAHITGTAGEVIGVEPPAPHDVIQRRLYLLRLAAARRQGAFHLHAAVAVAVDLELGVLVGIVDMGRQLAVQALHMV
ncbi:hypothetical protein D3C80_1773630 [compost metagenome]